MSKDKINSKSGENQEETNNPRREFMGKAAIIAATIAVGSIAGGTQLLGKEKTIGLNEGGLVMLKDGKVYDGPGLMNYLGLDFPSAKDGCTLCIIQLRCRKLEVDVGLSIANPVNVNLGGGRTKRIDDCQLLIFPSSQSVVKSLQKRGIIATKTEMKNIRKGKKNIKRRKK